VRSLFNRWNAQVFADFPRQQIDNLVMAGDRRAFVLTRIVPPRMTGTVAQQFAAVADRHVSYIDGLFVKTFTGASRASRRFNSKASRKVARKLCSNSFFDGS
jgi:hypothetical protein